MKPLIVFFPGVYTGSGPSYTAISIAREMARSGQELRFFCSGTTAQAPPEVDLRAVPLMGIPYRLVGKGPVKAALKRIAQRRVLRELRRWGPGASLHLWGGADLEFVDRAKAVGTVIFRELINTHMGTAKRILDAESDRLGLPAQHSATDDGIARQQAELRACNYICSPAAGVDASLDEWGVEPERVIHTSFGWEPKRFALEAGQPVPKRSHDSRVTALFVGQLSIRKGIHFALDAWRAAGVEGQFILVGRVEPDFRPFLEASLGQNGITHHQFTPDITGFYRSAVFLAFPTFEAGAPLICYEATGCGLPVVTTQMGSARLIEDDRNGRIVDAHDHNELVQTIRSMSDPQLRQRLSQGAAEIAQEWTWARAAKDRMHAFAERAGCA